MVHEHATREQKLFHQDLRSLTRETRAVDCGEKLLLVGMFKFPQCAAVQRQWILESDPLHFILREPFLRPIVEFCRARALVRRHLLRVFQCSTVGHIGGDPGRPKRVIADRRVNADRDGAAAHHAPSIRLRHGFIG